MGEYGAVTWALRPEDPRMFERIFGERGLPLGARP